MIKDVIGEAEAERKTTLINGMAERKLEHRKVLDTENLIYRALSDRYLCFYPNKRRMKSFRNTLQPQTAFQGPKVLLCVH